MEPISALMVLGGSALVAWKALKKDDKKTLPSGGFSNVPSNVPTPEPGKPIPAEYMAALNTLLSATTGDPAQYEALATQLASMGYTNEATALRQKAADLRVRGAVQPGPSPAPTPAPYVAPAPTPAPYVAPAPTPNIPSIPSIPVPPPPSVTQILLPTGSPLLRRGSAGAEVLKWQGFLRYMGRNEVAADGQFGPITETATKWFQASKSISADGIVGPQTVAAARASLPTASTSGMLISGVGSLGPRQVQCLAPNGCWLRQNPTEHARKLGFIPAHAQASLITYAKGQKANAGAPGPGGWAHIAHGGVRGWVPAEWLKLGR